ncbi:pentapeptide repeat-containing protein [Streptomyces sp. NPDC006367]|uniref:pentapeptide repeat-containing protein n=1 Tax=unclassified Streptomyces TaxID=2593676 RepID=UPI0033A9925E
MPAPRDLSDLPYAGHLVPLLRDLERADDLDTVHIDGRSYEGADLGGIRFLESALTSVQFAAGRMRRARFNDVWMHTVRWVATDLSETDWRDVEVTAGHFAGLELFSARLRRVVFRDCKFDSVNMRATTLHDVAFVDCLLRDVDFAGAGLQDVSFPGADLDDVRFTKARMRNVDLRQVTSLGITDGFDALKGATVTSAQMVELAPALARLVGLDVRDR